MSNINFNMFKAIKLNKKIHKNSAKYKYHMNHIIRAATYGAEINAKLDFPVERNKLNFALLMHDILKGSVSAEYMDDNDKKSDYIKDNYNILNKLNLYQYWKKMSKHAVAGGIFVYNLLKESNNLDGNEDIVRAIMFHSYPIVAVYKNLNKSNRIMIDIVVLADKLSSNWIKINDPSEESPKYYLEEELYGKDKKQIKFDYALVKAREIGMGDPEKAKKQNKKAYLFYKDRWERQEKTKHF